MYSPDEIHVDLRTSSTIMIIFVKTCHELPYFENPEVYQDYLHDMEVPPCVTIVIV